MKLKFERIIILKSTRVNNTTVVLLLRLLYNTFVIIFRMLWQWTSNMLDLVSNIRALSVSDAIVDMPLQTLSADNFSAVSPLQVRKRYLDIFWGPAIYVENRLKPNKYSLY